MSKVDIKIPSPGESITEVDISEWRVSSGDFVNQDDVILVIDSDKASLEVAAEASGSIEISVQEGETVEVGAVVGSIDTAATAGASAPKQEKDAAASATATSSAPAGAVDTSGAFSPAAAKLAAEKNLSAEQLQGTAPGGRITKEDVLRGPQTQATPSPAPETKAPELPQVQKTQTGERETRKKMSSLRKKVASRLVMAQHTAAILTTFNEIDLSRVMKLRSEYKETFEKKHDIRLGFMSFFTKAVVQALKDYPDVNSYIDGEDLIERNYYDISVAVAGKKGLLVPVIRDADLLSIAEIEKTIKYYAIKAKEGTLSVDEMTGGGFTISNGGVFGSLLSTPILNPPQTGILGLHKIEERPIAIKGEVVVRPMMYVALSYDHRIIDGKQSVGFLVRIKEIMEEPSRLLLEV